MESMVMPIPLAPLCGQISASPITLLVSNNISINERSLNLLRRKEEPHFDPSLSDFVSPVERSSMVIHARKVFCH